MAPPIEISIPTTSPVGASGGDKAYTLYNITIRLPLRSYVFQKRYSEFATLHQTITNLVGEAPPSPLPGKSWFRSTIASSELTETRRSGLETYLRAIAESPDRRWRDTSAWRAFLNLPSTSGAGSSAASGRSNQGIAPMAQGKNGAAGHERNGSTTGTGTGSAASTAEGRLPAIGLAAANAAAASDPGTWLDLHKEMKRALHDARMQLARRDAAMTAGSGSGMGNSTTTAIEAGAAAKRELIKTGSLLSALTTGLQNLQTSKRLGEGELRRRRDLLAAARVERDGLETLSTSLASARATGAGSSGNGLLPTAAGQAPPNTGDKAVLFGSAAAAGNGNGRSFGGGRVLGAPLPETEQTRELENAGVVQLQKQKMAEQDQDVATLAKIVQRQRELGLAIKGEVDMQNDMLTQLTEDTDRVQGKMKVAKDRIKRLN